MDQAGGWNLLTPIDVNDVSGQSITDYLKTGGLPRYYDKLASSIVLHPKPLTANVTLTGGLKMYFQRAPSYFTASDTTKIPGFPSIFHSYLSLGAQYDYAKAKQLPQLTQLQNDIAVMEDAMREFMSLRNKDEHLSFTTKYKSYR